MNDLDRYAVSLENMEVLRAQVEELEAWKAEELALMNPLMDYARSVCTGPLGCSLTDWLVSDHQKQAREIERLEAELEDVLVDWGQIRLELAAMKAQPSGVVSQADLIEALEEVWEKSYDFPAAFALAARDLAQSLSEPASAGDENSEEGLDEWAKGKFGIGGRYTGKLYGNTDWALARVVWSAALSRAALSANHSEPVLVPEGWVLVPVEPTNAMTHIGQSLRYDSVNSIGHIYRQMLAAAPSAGSQGGDV